MRPLTTHEGAVGGRGAKALHQVPSRVLLRHQPAKHEIAHISARGGQLAPPWGAAPTTQNGSSGRFRGRPWRCGTAAKRAAQHPPPAPACSTNCTGLLVRPPPPHLARGCREYVCCAQVDGSGKPLRQLRHRRRHRLGRPLHTESGCVADGIGLDSRRGRSHELRVETPQRAGALLGRHAILARRARRRLLLAPGQVLNKRSGGGQVSGSSRIEDAAAPLRTGHSHGNGRGAVCKGGAQHSSAARRSAAAATAAGAAAAAGWPYGPMVAPTSHTYASAAGMEGRRASRVAVRAPGKQGGWGKQGRHRSLRRLGWGRRSCWARRLAQ